VEIKPHLRTMDVWLKSYKPLIRYTIQNGFPLADINLADKIINDSLDKLYENKLFGSGWPVYPNREYVNFGSNDNYSVIYEK
jgi:hypothetical protein